MSAIFKFAKSKDKQQNAKKQNGGKQNAEKQNGGEGKSAPLDLEKSEKHIRDLLGDSADLVCKAFDTTRRKAMIVYFEGLVDKDLIDRDILRPLKETGFNGDVAMAIKTVYKESSDINAITDFLLDGFVALFYGDSGNILLIEFRKWDKRSVEEPNAEAVVRGPKEGFTESIRTNTALIRRKLKTPNLRIENFKFGRQTKTVVELIYIDDIVNKEVLKEAKNRLSQIDVDSVLESGIIEQHIDHNTFLPISGIGVTQKPDSFAQRILEGRVGILVDGTPHALTIPELFIENLHTTEDYYNRIYYTTVMRALRVVGLFITVMLMGLSVAILTFHQEMIPAEFLNSIISASEKTPLPMFAETFILVVMFELLKEAGTRLPKTVGSAITIVGSLIIGDAAVTAGIVSAPMVIVVALTAVTSFMLPNLNEFVIVYRTLFWLLGSILGLIGIAAGFFIMITQLASTESFGVNILSSFSKQEMKDVAWRFPLGSMKFRPSSIAKNNIRRQK